MLGGLITLLKKTKNNTIFSLFKGKETQVLFTQPFQQNNGTSAALLHRNTRWLNRNMGVKNERKCFFLGIKKQGIGLTFTNISDDQIPHWGGHGAISTLSKESAIKSSRKRCTRLLERRLCHRMDALSNLRHISNHKIRGKWNPAYSPTNSKTIVLFI